MLTNTSRIILFRRGSFPGGIVTHLGGKQSLHSSTSLQKADSSPEGEGPNLIHKDAKKIVGILGGGISGLSTAYYLVKNYGDKIHPIIFERGDRVGGWMRTVTTGKGSRFEMGPRTIRPAGISGLNTLDLVEELMLEKEVLFVQKSHPTANNRSIFVKGKLTRLPSDTGALFKKQEPFSKALVWAGLRDLFAFRKVAADDSIHSFVNRRFGPEIADYLIDPFIRGICAGDAKKISVKFLLKNLFELEQKYGSVIVGQVLSRMRKNKCQLTDEDKTIGFSKIAIASLHGNWAVWTLEQGLESLARTLEGRLLDHKVQIRKNTTVKSIQMQGNVDEVDVNFYTHDDEKRSDSIMVNHVISTIPSFHLSEIMKLSRPHNPELRELFETVHSANIQVTGLAYDDPELIDVESFGFLVPSSETLVEGLLGIVFDSNSFPQGDKTIITVMSRSADGSFQDLNKIKWYVEKTLGVTKEPIDHHSEFLSGCIPQYTVGHYEKADAIKRFIKAAKLPLTLAGASWDGVSVNDCIYGGRKAADVVGQAGFPAADQLRMRSSSS